MTKLSPATLFVAVLSLAAAVALSLAGGGAAVGQSSKKKDEVPEVERLLLQTKDGVMIRCDYYPGGVIERASEKKKDEKEYITRPGKEVVPIILLHGFEGQRSEYTELARFLQRQGHAVVVPDLRGHGDSTTRRFPNGAEEEIDRDRMRSTDLKAMLLDVEAVKKFLLDKNNEGTVNIEQLCVVGSELGAIVAVDWARHDWNWPQLPAFKQGRDVKALVLLSPEQSFKGYTLNDAIRHPIILSKLSVMIIAGQRDRSRYSDAKAIHKRLERARPEVTDAREVPDKKDLYLLEPDVALHGTQLLDPRARLPVPQSIGLFVDLRLVRKSDLFPWAERKSPLSGTE